MPPGDDTAAPEDPQLFRLKQRASGGLAGERRTLFTVLSGVLTASAGALLIIGGAMPWLSIGGVSVAAVREGGPDGAAATFCMVVGAGYVVLGLVSAIGRRGLPRFAHWLTLILAPLIWGLVHYRSGILGNLVFIHNADLREEGLAVVGPGIEVVYAGIALSVVAPLLSLRQALRALRT
jgi:hypothetical protein